MIFASIVLTYTTFEFVLKRFVWQQSSGLALSGKELWGQAVALLVMLVVSTICFINPRLVAGYAATAFLYGLYDLVLRKWSARRLLQWFFLKQALLFIGLYLVWRISIPYTVHGWAVSLGSWMASRAGGLSPTYGNFLINIFIVVSAYMFMVDGGTKIVRGVLENFPILYANAIASLSGKEDKATYENIRVNAKGESSQEAENAGEWIGVLERIITLTFVLTSSYTAIAFALTAKSIARFKELENKDFAEYYLLGTSSSIVVALVTGVLVKQLFY